MYLFRRGPHGWLPPPEVVIPALATFNKKHRSEVFISTMRWSKRGTRGWYVFHVPSITAKFHSHVRIARNPATNELIDGGFRSADACGHVAKGLMAVLNVPAGQTYVSTCCCDDGCPTKEWKRTYQRRYRATIRPKNLAAAMRGERGQWR